MMIKSKCDFCQFICWYLGQNHKTTLRIAAFVIFGEGWFKDGIS
jgi:hypothetical protein